MKRLLLASTLLFTTAANAGNVNLILGSYHITDHHGLAHNSRHGKEDYNEINPGISYTTDENISFGVFLNSYRGTTVFAGKRFERKNLGLDLGVSYYGNFKFKDEARIAPIVQVTYDVSDWRIGFGPMISEDTYGVFTLQYVIPYNW